MFTTTSTITVNRSVADVYQFLLDPRNYPKWITNLKAPDSSQKPFSPGLQFDEIAIFNGKEKRNKVIIRETTLNKKVQMEVTEVISGTNLKPLRTWELFDEGGKTKIVWTTVVKTGSMYRLLEFMLPKPFQKKMDEFMANLKIVLEKS